MLAAHGIINSQVSKTPRFSSAVWRLRSRLDQVRMAGVCTICIRMHSFESLRFALKLKSDIWRTYLIYALIHFVLFSHRRVPE